MKTTSLGEVLLTLSLLLGSAGCGPNKGVGEEADGGAVQLQPDSGTSSPDADLTPPPGQPDAAPPPPPPLGSSPGAACSCDSDCPAVGSHDPICVYGVCMTRASDPCASAGSTGECGSGSRCWGLQGVEGYLCWPDCDSYDCDGVCDSDGSCAPTAEMNCEYDCGTYCSCQPGDCADGATCVNGVCVASSGDGPGTGPGPDCPGLPPRDCTGSATYCAALVTFDPRTTAHYDDYPINGEAATNQYRSYLRRDLAMLIDHATAKTLCKTAAWDTGNGGALGLGDMSEATGAIPGTSIGSPGHPAGTHTNGRDIDIGYYQQSTADNRLRPICTYANEHCTAPPHLLDVWRHAFLLGVMFESASTRVIGVDGQAGPMLDAAITELCNTGWLSAAACNNYRLAYATTPDDSGWYYFHHHHTHVSVCDGPCPTSFAPTDHQVCKVPGCEIIPVKPNPHRAVPAQ